MEKKLVLGVVDGQIEILAGLEHLDGIIVELRDYDVQGVDPEILETDDNGREFYLQSI